MFLLLRLLKEMGLAEVIDAYLKPHGDWGEELSLGDTLCVWLGYILSQGDHRLSAVEGWAASLLETLRRVVLPELTPKALCDDRLARALRYLAQDEEWAALERGLGQRLIRVYALPQDKVRLDTSTLSTYTVVREERWVLRSQGGYERHLEERLEQAERELEALNRRGQVRYTSRERLAERVQAILERYQVVGLLQVTYRCQVTKRLVRGYKGRPSCIEQKQEEAVAECKACLGWWVYLGNGAAQCHPMGAGTVLQAFKGLHLSMLGGGTEHPSECSLNTAEADPWPVRFL